MKNTFTILCALSLASVAACSSKPSIDIGHDNPDADTGATVLDSGVPVFGDASPESGTVTDAISCPYGWTISPASPLDVCCQSTSLDGKCAVIARGDRPFTCNETADGCGCALGGGNHRYELRCNQAIGCECMMDGFPIARVAGDPQTGFPPRIDPYICGGGVSAMKSAWYDTCKFPDPAQATTAAPCGYGFYQQGTSCCNASGSCWIPSSADQPFSLTTGDGRGCGGYEATSPHYYSMKCTPSQGCICAVNGFVVEEGPVAGVTCGGEDRAVLLDHWKKGCGFPPH